MPISGKKIVSLLQKRGWRIISQKGSHVKMKNAGVIVVVPVHGNKDLPRGTVKSIEGQAGEKVL